MKTVKITVLKKACYEDLKDKYENPLDEECPLDVGQIFYSYDANMPDGFCANAWPSLKEFVEKLANGEGNFYGNWMKNPFSAIISCNDGVRPVSFLLEAID